jgi:DNA helicase HerA-like ATPase
MADPMLIAKHAATECHLLPGLANRHGLITGATGTGKTVTLQTLAENFSRIGVPVFMADIKGDLTGASQPGHIGEKLAGVLKERGLDLPSPQACPTTLWDVFGEQGHPVRATISDMGPLLLGRMLNLNETQLGVLNLVFKIADDNGLLLLDLKDLRAMLQYVGDNAKDFTTEYGNISSASVGAIQRGLLQIEQQGGDKFFGEPMLNIQDFMQTVDGQGVINILAADKLMNSPRLYATFLLWMLSELFETLPEIGDPEKPKLVFFFDEAHLLFNEAPKVLIERIELVVRLVRSKGVGVYFVTQNPLDIPDSVLAQLGNRVQHALRAFTPRDQKAVKATATTMRQKPGSGHRNRHHRTGRGRGAGELSGRQGPPQRDRARVCAAPRQPARAHHAPAAPGAHRAIAGGRDLRKSGGPGIGLRKAQRPHRGCGSASPCRHRCGQDSSWRQRQRRRRTAGRPERRAVWLHRPARWPP